jgi:hypothetical protein
MTISQQIRAKITPNSGNLDLPCLVKVLLLSSIELGTMAPTRVITRDGGKIMIACFAIASFTSILFLLSFLNRSSPQWGKVELKQTTTLLQEEKEIKPSASAAKVLPLCYNTPASRYEPLKGEWVSNAISLEDAPYYNLSCPLEMGSLQLCSSRKVGPCRAVYHHKISTSQLPNGRNTQHQ